MKKIILTLIVVSAQSLLAGCATYISPENSSTQITFELSEGAESNGNQFYSIYPVPECSEKEGYGMAANMMKLWGMGGSDTTVSVLSGEEIYLLAEVKTHTGGSTVYTRSCRNFVSFTPLEGKHYVVKQKNKCKGVSVKDNVTAQPVDVQNIKLPYSCSFKVKKS